MVKWFLHSNSELKIVQFSDISGYLLPVAIAVCISFSELLNLIGKVFLNFLSFETRQSHFDNHNCLGLLSSQRSTLSLKVTTPNCKTDWL